MRFKADENLPNSVVELLRAAGHDVHSVLQEGLSGGADSAVLAAAISEKRCLITLDKDFADIRTYPPDQHCGILVLRPRDQRVETIRSAMARATPLLETADLTASLWIVDERRVRTRR